MLCFSFKVYFIRFILCFLQYSGYLCSFCCNKPVLFLFFKQIPNAKIIIFNDFTKSDYLFLSSQKATAAAAATLSESTVCDMGMRATWSALSMVLCGSPSPSVPMIIASLGMVVRVGESISGNLA